MSRDSRQTSALLAVVTSQQRMLYHM